VSGKNATGAGFAAALYEKLPFPVLVLDEAARLVSRNAAAARAFGWNGDPGKPVHGRVLDGEAEGLLARYAAGGAEAAHPLRFVRADGSVFETVVQVLALGADGAPYALLFCGLAEGNDGSDAALCLRINAALDSIPEGFAIFDGEERLVMFNRTFKEMCGDARDEVRIGTSLEEIVRANIRVGTYRDIREGLLDGEAFLRTRLDDHRSVTPAGIVFTYGEDRWMRAENHRTSLGDIAALRVDVTALKRVETELEKKRREYLSLLQILPDMIIRFDNRLVIRFVNDRYAARFGMTAEQMTGMDMRAISPSPRNRRLQEEVLDFLPDAPVKTREVCSVTQDGQEIWTLWTAVATFENGKVAEVVAVGRDITEVKHQHQKVEAQALELRKKNEALDQFTATVSHDLKAPLRHLSMFSEMIAEDVRADRFEDLANYAGQLRKSTARMRRIIDSLLEYAQIAWRIADLRPVPLGEVVRDALALLEGHVAESTAEIEVGALPEVTGDPELLRRLAQNLIGNAIKYCVPGMPPRIRIYGQAEGDGIRFVVEDEGIGIEPRHAERVFDVFCRLHRDETVYQGTGVGLALARRIAESHGGTIAIDADYRPGARFVVTFPRRAAE